MLALSILTIFFSIVGSEARWTTESGGQKSLQEVGAIEKPKGQAIEVEEIAGNLIVDVYVGSPPQKIRGVLDINQDRMMSIPTTDCSGLCRTQVLFNYCKSDTYKQHNGLYRDIYYPAGISTWGPTANDTVSVGAYSIENFEFVSTNQIDPLRLDAWKDFLLWDVVVGLAPFDIKYKEGGFSVSWIRGLVKRAKLGRNLFTLKGAGAHKWELAFGEVAEEFGNRDFRTYPLAPEAFKGEGEWLFNSTNSSLVIKDHEMKMPVSQITLSTTEYRILLPALVVDYLHTVISAGSGGWVSCYTIRNFPVLKFELGGEVLELKGEDYTFRTPGYWADTCFSAVGVGEEGKALLGSTALRGFYSVFDLDEGAVKVTEI